MTTKIVGINGRK